MEWSRQFDGYCERVDFAFWAEPVNAVTNAAFILAALFMWRRSAGSVPAQVLCVILFAIGVGSFLFHTFATGWAALADTAPIGIFILVYLFLVNRDALGLPWWAACLATAMFVPFAAIVVPVMDRIPFLRISDFYWTVPILLLGYGLALRRRRPEVTAGLWIGAALLTVSICLRSLDMILCPTLPIGTHFAWHVLNAVMLAWMIHVYRARIVISPPR